MLNLAPKNVGGRVPKLSLILTLSPQGCDEGRGLYRWPETTNIYSRGTHPTAFVLVVNSRQLPLPPKVISTPEWTCEIMWSYHRIELKAFDTRVNEEKLMFDDNAGEG